MDPLCYFLVKPLCSLTKHHETTLLKLMWPQRSCRSLLLDFCTVLQSLLKLVFLFEERTDVLIWNSLLYFEASESWLMIIRVLITAGVLRPESGCCVMACGSYTVYTPAALYAQRPLLLCVCAICVYIDVLILLICAILQRAVKPVWVEDELTTRTQ